MKLYAIADLHLGHPTNRDALEHIAPHPDDWLILAGDVGEAERHIDAAFTLLNRRFAKLIWVPGNHELWTTARGTARGEARYQSLVALARSHGVVTPEDPYPVWPGDGRTVIVPLFLLYDYSFRPDFIGPAEVLAWAGETGTLCADESLLHPDPYPTRAAWCEARVADALGRLAALPHDAPTILVNHFPLEQRHAVLPAIPRFTPWCGTRATAGWPVRFRARAVVYGHIHLRRHFVEDGVQFHEVSLGYPRQWDQARTIDSYLREILAA